jgi:hypothetical protein
MATETPYLASLREKLAAREKVPGDLYEKNCEELRKEIARHEKCQDLDL